MNEDMMGTEWDINGIWMEYWSIHVNALWSFHIARETRHCWQVNYRTKWGMVSIAMSYKLPEGKGNQREKTCVLWELLGKKYILHSLFLDFSFLVCEVTEKNHGALSGSFWVFWCGKSPCYVWKTWGNCLGKWGGRLWFNFTWQCETHMFASHSKRY